MPYRFVVYVATTGQEIGRYFTQAGAEAAALRRSNKEQYLEVWRVDDKFGRQALLSRFAYGKSQPVKGRPRWAKKTPL
jgi:hypothetical protein